MWGRARKTIDAVAAETAPPAPLKLAIRQVRIELAEQLGVVVDLHDAELVRLELLNDALDPAFSEIPPGLDLVDRGMSRGDTPRLWIDAIAHVAMARDKRTYRFMQDTRYGRKVLAESNDVAAIVAAVTHYVAARMVERERALAGDDVAPAVAVPRRGGRLWLMFLLGAIAGAGLLFAALWVAASRLPH